jgi:hypothetical protein
VTPLAARGGRIGAGFERGCSSTATLVELSANGAGSAETAGAAVLAVTAGSFTNRAAGGSCVAGVANVSPAGLVVAGGPDGSSSPKRRFRISSATGSSTELE